MEVRVKIRQPSSKVKEYCNLTLAGWQACMKHAWKYRNSDKKAASECFTSSMMETMDLPTSDLKRIMGDFEHIPEILGKVIGAFECWPPDIITCAMMIKEARTVAIIKWFTGQLLTIPAEAISRCRCIDSCVNEQDLI